MAKEKNEKLIINIYKLRNDVDSLEEMLSNFESKLKDGIDILKDKQIISVEENIRILYFSFKNIENEEDAKELSWYKKWKDFFNINGSLRTQYLSGHGVIVIEVQSAKYAIVFGRSFRLIKEYIEECYGLIMAEKLFTCSEIDSVSSKFFSQRKNKTLVSFIQETAYLFGEGEAIDLIKGRISSNHDEYIEKLCNYVSQMVTTGYSNIKLTIKKEKIQLEDIIKIIESLYEIEKNSNTQCEIPYMKRCNKDKEKELNIELLNLIKEEDSSILFMTPFFQKDDNDNYIFSDSIDSVTIEYRREEEVFSVFDLGIRELKKFIDKNNVIEIEKIMCIIQTTSGEYKKKLLQFLEAQKDNFVLYNGKWYTYNEKYYEIVRKSIEKIEKDESKTIILESSADYTITEDDLNAYYASSKELSDQLLSAFKKNNTSNEKKEIYFEFKYNFYLCKKFGFELLDRKIFKSIEVCDIYEVGNETLCHCKKGKTNQLEECLRQSLLGLQCYLQNKDDEKFYEFMEGKLSGKNRVSCAKVLFLSKIKKFKLSNTKSLRLQLTFLEWYRYCKEKNITPKLVLVPYQEKKENK